MQHPEELKEKLYQQDVVRKRAEEVLRNLNWLIEAHDSYVELVKVDGMKVVVRCIGSCIHCETDCVGLAFEAGMPGVELIRM